MRAEFFEQVIEVRQTIGLMTVNDQIFFAVGGSVNDLMRHDYAAKTHSGELINELVVVAGDVNYLGLLATFAKKFLDEHVVVVAPIPAEF